jgi:ADP-ribose pyrophosphatase
VAGSKEYPEHPRVAVGAVVMYQARVLMVRRRDPPNQGLWAIPGGGLRLGESLQAAAEREIWEETGVRIRAGEPVYIFDVVHRDARGRVRFHYVITDLAAEYLEGEPRARDDAADAAWLSAEDIQRLPVNDTSLDLLVNRLGFRPGNE